MGGGWLRIERKGGRRGGLIRVEMSFDCGDLRGVSRWRGGEGGFLQFHLFYFFLFLVFSFSFPLFPPPLPHGR